MSPPRIRADHWFPAPFAAPAAPLPEGPEPLGGPGRIALPALRNAHDHGRAVTTLAAGAGDAVLEVWLAATALAPAVDPGLEARVAFGRMARGGIAATQMCLDVLDPAAMPAAARRVAEAARTVGIGLALALPVIDRNLAGYVDMGALAARLPPADRAALAAAPRPPAAEQIAAVEAAAAEAEGNGVSVEIHAVGPTWCSPALLEAVAAHSAATGRRVFMHLLETTRQRRWCDTAFPEGPVRALDRLGLLSPRLACAHGVHLRADEIALLAERGVRLAVNTSSNLRLGSGVAPVAAFRAAGLGFGLGLDSFGFDDAPDLLTEARLARLVHRGTGVVPALPDAALWAALAGGHDGRAAPGDVMLVDLEALAPDRLPGADPLALLAGRGAARHVRDLVAGGRVVLRDGRLTGIDLAAEAAELLAAARRAGPGADPGRIGRLVAALQGLLAEEDTTR